MRISVNVKIPGGHPTKVLTRYRNYISYGLLTTINDIGTKLTEFVKTKYMSGGAEGVEERSGRLLASTHAVKATSRKSPVSGVAIGDAPDVRKRLRTIMSQEPRVKIIQAKDKLLTIPMGKALADAKAGNYKTAADYGGLIARNGILWKGDEAMFRLKASVKVRTKIHTNKIMNRYAPIALKLLKKDFPGIK